MNVELCKSQDGMGVLFWWGISDEAEERGRCCTNPCDVIDVCRR